MFQLHMAQYGMLADLAQQAAEPTEGFLETLCASCLAQEQADSTFQIHWSRHLLACLRAVTGAELLVGARAVTFNPHFQHYYSPSANDIALGAVDQWLPVPALMLLDSFEPAARSELLLQASKHPKEVWVLKQDLPPNTSAADRKVLAQLGVRLCAQIPKKSLMQQSGSESSWDSSPSALEHRCGSWVVSVQSVMSSCAPLASN